MQQKDYKPPLSGDFKGPMQRTGITKDNLQKMKLNDSKLYEKYATTTESRVFQVKKIVK